MEGGGRGGAAASASPIHRHLARKAGADGRPARPRPPRGPNLRVLPPALLSLGSPTQATARPAAERRLAGWSWPSCAPRHWLGGKGKGGGGGWVGAGAGRSSAHRDAAGRGRPRSRGHGRSRSLLSLPPSPPPLRPRAHTRPPRPYSTPFPGQTPSLSLCVRALNNFILFGKRNNAPDFTRGKQQAEQNKEQM